MLQSFLEERFELTVRQEVRPLPLYALMVAKTGPKLRELREDETIPTFAGRPPESANEKGSFAEIVSLFALCADLPVIDETGIVGRFEYASLNFTQFVAERRSDPFSA
jgi:uncharacterized protein (TIGR03435 family)